MSLRMKRLVREKMVVEHGVARGDILAAVWTEDLGKLEITHDAGEVFGHIVTEIKFPTRFPIEPPTMRILSDIRHPNVYREAGPAAGLGLKGLVCMSILDAEAGIGQGAAMCWTTTYHAIALIQALEAVLLEPATDSPADVDTNKMFMGNPEEYRRINEGFKKLRSERRLKAEQEKEFAEADLRDQEREVALKEAELSEVEARGAEEQQVREAKQILPEEPPVDSAVPLVNIRFRTPSETLARRFRPTDTLHTLLLFLQSKGYQPEKYKVLCTYPQRDLSGHASSSSLESLKLCPQETLTLEAVASDSD